MTPERYQRINELADEVLEIPASGRATYLAGACGGDAGLRRQVELLVEAHESSGAFLEQPAVERLAHEIAQNRATATLAGREIGKYRVLSRLGAGGHGEVWLAEDTQLLRKVAIKLLSVDLGTRPDHVRRLYAEARICSALNHPNIVTIYDTGEVEGDAFLAQEYVEGETLRRQLARGAMPVDAAARIVQQVIAALAASHAAGVIHQDIKPENIMIRPDGLVKVLDFGLARFVERDESNGAGARGTVMGTVKYMSPEQAQGLPVDARTDIFSLGVVFFEMLTGKTPFTGATAEEILTAILNQEPDLTGVPRSMEALVRRCLARNKEKRYASSAALRAELDRATRGRHLKRRRWLATAALVMVAAAGLATYRGRMGPGPFESMKISLLTTAAAAPSAAVSPDGARIAYVLEEPLGQSLWLRTFGSTVDTRLLAPEAGDHRRLAFSPDGVYIYYCWMPTSRGGALYRVAVRGGPAEKIFDRVNDAFAVAPDGQHFAFMRIDQERWEESLIVVGTDGRGERTIATRRRPQYYASSGLAWSPDGKSLLCTAGNAPFYNANAFHLVRVDLASGAEKPIGNHTWAWVGSLLWSNDGRSLIVGANDHSIGSLQIWRVSFPDGDTRRITNDLSNYENLTLSADAKTLLAVRHDKTSDLMVALLNGAAPRISSPDLHDLNSAGWASGTRIVYSALGGSAMNLWGIDSNGQHRKQLTNADSDQSEVEVSRDGRYIFFTSGGRLWRVDADGSDLRKLTPGPLDVHPAATPDGQWVVYAAFQGWSPGIGGQPTLWKVRIDGGERVPLTREPTSCPNVSPDGTKISCAYFPPGQTATAPKIAVYSIHGGEVLQTFDRPAGSEDNVYWSADGKGIDYLVTDSAGSRILRQMVKGGAPTVAAAFPGDRFSFVRPSPDGHSLAVARGNEARELVVLRDIRE
jgi:Tol biopolymer transport system component